MYKNKLISLFNKQKLQSFDKSKIITICNNLEIKSFVTNKTLEENFQIPST